MTRLEPHTTAAASATHRSQLYALLSAGCRYPSADFCQTVSGGQFAGRLQAASASLPYSLSDHRAGAVAPGVAELQDAYTHLFDVGSVAGPPCCLYEGEYGGGRMGVIEDVLRFYHFFGLRLSQEERERPDHLATELEFLHWLTFQEAAAAEQGDTGAVQACRAATRDFLAEHAGDLAAQVAGRLAANGAPFYPGLIRLAAEACAQDLAYLRGQGEAPGGAASHARSLALELRGLRDDGRAGVPAQPYALRTLRAQPTKWDRIAKGSHITNCWYQRSCNFNLFVSDGVVLREEQVGNYPPPNDPTTPDGNPRGCQKGACYAHRTYDAARIKYPLKRAGARGTGRWQRISWDQALSEIADQVIDVLTTDGPECIIQGGGTHVHSLGSEGMGTNSFFEALNVPLPVQSTDIGDDHQGAALTLGKVVFADSPDNWFYADIILIWGGNPAYTNIPAYHYIPEARYTGARVITISPDSSASAIHADRWVPVNVGTDAALALAMCQVIVHEGRHNQDFIREQTDLPLLVRVDTGKLLREKDLKRGGREDIFSLYDQGSGHVVQAPRKTLALNGLVPALEGEYQVQTLQGPVRVRPVFELLRDRLNAGYRPEQVASVTGTPAAVIEQLAREIAAASGVIGICASSFSKFYHGDLIERAILLVFALCGHMGRKGATYSAFPLLTPDTGLGAWERQGRQMLQTAAGADPRYAAWKEDGYTTEMILTEYAKDAVAAGALASTTLVQYVHGGLLEISERYQSWDPHLKRPLGEYVAEALAKGWQTVIPAPQKAPKILFHWGGNLFRRGRGTDQLLKTLLPKLTLIVSIDWRMTTSGLYADYVLPICGWYERTSTNTLGSTHSPFFQINDKAVDPLYESLGEWALTVRLARKIGERAQARGVLTFRDRSGKDRRLDAVEDRVTARGLYAEDDEEGVARDAFLNASNREAIEWKEFKARGIAAYTSLGSGVKALNNACDMEVGEPIVPLTWHTERKDPYPTLTRRMQFYIDHDWYLELDEQLPTHKDCPKVGGDHPLQLTGGHARWSIHSDWVDDSIILGLQRGEPVMFTSAEDAAARGIRDGDLVEVFNEVASFRIHAMVSPAVRPGQAIIYHSWENYQFDGWRHFKSVMASPLNPIELVGGYGHLRPDPLTLMPGLHDRGTRVEVRKAE